MTMIINEDSAFRKTCHKNPGAIRAVRFRL